MNLIYFLNHIYTDEDLNPHTHQSWGNSFIGNGYIEINK